MVKVVAATEEERPVVRRLLELYSHDFSEFDGRDVNVHGEYGYQYLDHYWTEPDRAPFLITVDGRWAGLALVRRIGDVHDMAEFFVMRKYRRTGVGRVAAEKVFAQFRGLWTIRQLHSNKDATAFWRTVIDYSFDETRTEAELIQRFDTRT